MLNSSTHLYTNLVLVLPTSSLIIDFRLILTCLSHEKCHPVWLGEIQQSQVMYPAMIFILQGSTNSRSPHATCICPQGFIIYMQTPTCIIIGGQRMYMYISGKNLKFENSRKLMLLATEFYGTLLQLRALSSLRACIIHPLHDIVHISLQIPLQTKLT